MKESFKMLSDYVVTNMLTKMLIKMLAPKQFFRHIFFFFQLNMSSVVQDSNEKHLAPWSEACSADNIVNTPLSPYLDKVKLFMLLL